MVLDETHMIKIYFAGLRKLASFFGFCYYFIFAERMMDKRERKPLFFPS